MQTFSIAAGEYEGYSFRVNPVDSSMVEFCHPNADGESQTIAQFKRNGLLVSQTVVPLARTHEVVRDAASGAPVLPDKAPDAKDETAVGLARDRFADKPDAEAKNTSSF